MHHYKYQGPVLSNYGLCITPNWSADTYAISKTKATSNIKYRYKKEHGLIQKTNIFLPNAVVEI